MLGNALPRVVATVGKLGRLLFDFLSNDVFCSGDQFLKALDIRYIDRWRDFGIFLRYTFFDAFLAFVSLFPSICMCA